MSWSAEGPAADIVFTPQHLPEPRSRAEQHAGADVVGPRTGRRTARSAYPFCPARPRFRWLVVDYDGVKNFGNATTHSFEMWIQLESTGFGTGPGQRGRDVLVWTEPDIPTDGPGLGNAGSGDPDLRSELGRREPRRPERGEHLPRPGERLGVSVNTTGPTPGGRATITYDAKRGRRGRLHARRDMTSKVTPGKTQEVVTLTVTK